MKKYRYSLVKYIHYSRTSTREKVVFVTVTDLLEAGEKVKKLFLSWTVSMFWLVWPCARQSVML